MTRKFNIYKEINNYINKVKLIKQNLILRNKEIISKYKDGIKINIVQRIQSTRRYYYKNYFWEK